jgi:hypothetical protein
LSAGKTYKIEANVYSQNTTGGSNDFYFEFVDATSNASIINGLFGISGILTTGSFLRNYNPNVSVIYTPFTNQTIKLRITNFAITSTDVMAATNVTVEQIGSTSFSILPIANGGTGSSTQNFVDLTTNQTAIAGVKNFTNNVGIGQSVPTSNLHVNGSIATGFVATTTTPYTVLATGSTIDLTLGGVQTVTLPTASAFYGRHLKIINNTTFHKTLGSYTGADGVVYTVLAAGQNIELVSNGTVLKEISRTNKAPVIQLFTANGTYTPTPGMRYVIVKMAGGGGAGGGASAIVSSTSVGVGGGGGSGGYVEAQLTAAQIGASQAVTIGAGGTGASGTNGGNGSATTLGALLSAGGGGGGLSVGASGNFATSTASGGTGGTITVTTGTNLVSRAGESGESGIAVYQASATVYSFASGNGGNNILGVGGIGVRQATVASAVTSTAGIAAAVNTGGGGSGAGNGGLNPTSVAGGNGGSGKIVIIEYF